MYEFIIYKPIGIVKIFNKIESALRFLHHDKS
jgi:hypothetical protein